MRKKEARKKRVWELRAKGFSLREIAETLECSHQTVKRDLDEMDDTIFEERFFWNDSYLTRSQIRVELNRLAKKMRWDRTRASYLANWQQRILEIVCEKLPGTIYRTRNDDLMEEFGWLLANGPIKPGRRNLHDQGISRDIREKTPDGVMVEVLSDWVRRDSEGNETPLEWSLWDGDSIFSRWKSPSSFTAPKKPRHPEGCDTLECPRCKRKTLYREPPCKVQKPDGTVILQQQVHYTSTRCQAGTCEMVELLKSKSKSPSSAKTDKIRKVRIISTTSLVQKNVTVID